MKPIEKAYKELWSDTKCELCESGAEHVGPYCHNYTGHVKKYDLVSKQQVIEVINDALRLVNVNHGEFKMSGGWISYEDTIQAIEEL